MRTLCVTIAFLLPLATSGAAQSAKIDTKRSTMTVEVGKSGLFSSFGHNHVIRAPITEGAVHTSSPASVELRVDAQRMQVLDPDLSAKDRAEVQKTMLSAAVLDSERFPEIRFVSRSVTTASSADGYRLDGELTLHGATRPLVVWVEHRKGHYIGTVTVKQSNFGIKPVAVAGGTVKVKDAVEIVFDIVTEAQSPNGPP
jgi:polyisoprenoid-binding protein YceI